MYDASLGKYCDHTVLRAYTKQDVVKLFCGEAKKYGAASVCVNPIHVALVKGELSGTEIKVCTVIGFPLGASTPAVKAYEAADAVQNGADELDMVINVGALRDGNDALVSEDISGVVEAAKGRPVKVIIETCYLSDDEKRRAAALCQKAGAAYVKTSSGFGTRGATVEDIRLIREVVGDTMKIKASTDINTQEDAKRMIEAGADRLGLSRVVQVVEGDANMPSASAYNKPPNY
ncbi:MAG: deoxyribose-phosphate aldolase [Oscillospiraceae bacterium]|nr:deoxyribose-phosphate aldolase [Oscillospiraceae bacterium]